MMPLNPWGQHALTFCTANIGQLDNFFSELHNEQMRGTVIWVEGRTVTVEVEPA